MDCCDTKPHKKENKINIKQSNAGNTTKKKSFVSYISSVSGISGVFSSYQVCHSICLAVISVLSLVGITLTVLPLVFLQKIALPLWTFAVALFGVGLLLYIKNGECMSKNLLIFNFGAILIGIPFEGLLSVKKYFLILGFIIILFSLYLIIRDRVRRNKK